MREIIYTRAFHEFLNEQPVPVREKLVRAVDAVRQFQVISTKLVKKLVDTDFYELRVSMGNEYRVIIFAVGHDNIIEANKVVLLNGFVKKSTNDYRKQIKIAINIWEALYETTT